MSIANGEFQIYVGQLSASRSGAVNMAGNG